MGVLRLLWRWLVVQWTLLKYALLGAADRLGLRRLWYVLAGRSAEYQKLTRPVWMRLAFEDLGPTFIKLAQIIASSEGLFPKEYSEEFRKCLDRVPPFPFEQVQQILKEEFGRPHTEVFATLDPKPVAAASIAQVHFATLPSGEEVVVKVQRPAIEPLVRADTKIMMIIARLVEKIIPHADLANPTGVVEDFTLTIFEELDFRLEGRNMDQFNEILKFAGNSAVVAPLVQWDYTTKRVLTMERFRGWRVDDTKAILASPYNAEEKLVNGLRGWFQSVILEGFFHGDVHAGNLMLLSDGRVGFLDFGIIGRFNDTQRHMVTEYIMAFQGGNFKKLAQILANMGSVDAGKVDIEAFAEDLKRCYSPWLSKSYADFKIRDLLPEVLRVSVKHRMRLPREFILITKQLLYFDRYAKALAPNLNIFTDPRLVGFIIEGVQLLQKRKAAEAKAAGAAAN
ncbi:MAG: AarF/UbiB family protein [Bdellovibrionota bacterium]